MATFEEKVQKQVEIIKQRTFLDPTLDMVFKKIFSKDVTLIHFLNAVLRPTEDRKIISIVRKKPASSLTSAIDTEEVRFDVHARLNNGTFVDLEMQRAWHEDFADHPYLMPCTYSVYNKKKVYGK